MSHHMLFDIAQKIMLRMDAETAHDVTLSILKRSANTPVDKLYRQSLKYKPIELMGLHFPNPVGLAAGLDKDGEAIDAFHAMGFGHVEVGTVTPRPQSGNQLLQSQTSSSVSRDIDNWSSIAPTPNFSAYVTESRFKSFDFAHK